MIIHSVLRYRASCITVTGMNAAAPKTRRRAASKEQRREQLIKATIKCIARKGLSNTTMADVTSTAKLSQGIVNLHFQSKDKLLLETLRYVAQEYKQGWDGIVTDSEHSPAEKINALIAHDFSTAIAHPNKLAVWFAFWGESGSRPKYRKICNEADLQTSASMQTLLLQLGCPSDKQAELIATGYTALADGLWLDLLVTPNDITRELARDVCLNYMASFFPDHFQAP
jgi:TetR/AcrR family transcriptional repressor of bet genes